MTDIVVRLRDGVHELDMETELSPLLDAAADEIERLREALAVIYKAADTERGENDEYWWVDNQTTVQSYICSVLGAPPEDALGEGK
jgi:hypothetical protein